jgi:hypothetical protein
MENIPTKWNDKAVKDLSIAQKYRSEQDLTANEAVKHCEHNLAIELYAGTGGLTKLYKSYFNEVITNDLNEKVETDWHYPAKLFIQKVLSKVLQGRKLDLIDFDCYGCPAKEIQEYFNIRKNLDVPFVLRFSDGLGLYLKRNKGEKVIRDRYLIEGDIVIDRIWRRHHELIDYFLKKIANQYGMKAEKIISVQTKFKNYVLGSYRFINI